jgi:hypothetical protein
LIKTFPKVLPQRRQQPLPARRVRSRSSSSTNTQTFLERSFLQGSGKRIDDAAGAIQRDPARQPPCPIPPLEHLSPCFYCSPTTLVSAVLSAPQLNY